MTVVYTAFCIPGWSWDHITTTTIIIITAVVFLVCCEAGTVILHFIVEDTEAEICGHLLEITHP